MSRQVALTQDEKYVEYDRAAKEVLVDFDATLCQWAYPDMGDPEPGAKFFMKQLLHRGLRPIVWTSRMSPEIYTLDERNDTLVRIMDWLEKHEIPYHEIDTGDSGKRLALAWVDDRAVHYSGEGRWEPVLRKIDHIKEMVEERQRRRRKK